MDPDRLEAEELAGRALDWTMVNLDLVGVELSSRIDAGVVLVQLGQHLTGLYGGCPEHGPCMAAVAFPGGRVVQLGQVADGEELVRAITDHPGLDADEAGLLLADLRAARVG